MPKYRGLQIPTSAIRVYTSFGSLSYQGPPDFLALGWKVVGAGPLNRKELRSANKDSRTKFLPKKTRTHHFVEFLFNLHRVSY